MSQTKTYDPANHFLSFLGNLISDGFGPDSFIKASRNTDAYSYTAGASGEGARTKSNDASGEVELTLLATSQANDILAAIGIADELTGAGIGPLFVKENGGTTVIAAQNAWIKRRPDIERGKEVGVVTWTFGCANMQSFAGGML